MISDQKIPEAFVEVFKDTVDRPIAFHPIFAKLTGSVTAGLLLSQAVYWTKRATSGGWFYKTIKQWEEETSLSRHEQETARKTLRRFSFWQEERRGVPAQMYYRVDMAALYNELLSIAESRKSRKTSNKEEKRSDPSRLPESGNLDCGKAANKDAGKRQTGMPETGKHYKGISETTTEITTETTTTTPLSPLQDVPGGRDFVERLLVGTLLQGADPGRIANVARKYKRTQEEIETAIAVLDQQYRRSTRIIDDPTGLMVSVLRAGIVPLEGYVANPAIKVETEYRREKTEKRRARETGEAEYIAAAERLSALPEKERKEIYAQAKAKLPSILCDSPRALKAIATEMMISRARAPG